ncbi:UvrD-helicase domain-containing protein [Sinomicrobium sp. M5D2P9]
MPQEINISTEDIQYIEKILLPEGKHFDQERLDFIRNFSTIDLQAVPGSGKTTALLAKLLILETQLPLESNRGVLILSHTNKAVNEIKERIGKHCPNLFSYPNFIGTIQSFVDHFLAIPYYECLFKQKPIRIDNEIFLEQLNNLLPYGSKIALQKRLKDKYYNFLLQLFIIRQEIVDFSTFESVSIPSIGNHTNTYKNLMKTKSELIKRGFLNFNDAYSFSKLYYTNCPKIIRILQERFKYVFVDEMQDMDTHQHNLLETIFFDEGDSKSVYQRIGDINQAIYSGEVHTDDIWKFRGIPLTINGSHRLSQNIAQLVNCFTMNIEGGFQVEGKNENNNLKPHLIVYELDKIKKVIPKFSQIVKNHIDSENIILSDKSKFKVIGWVKDKEGDKLGITDYSEQFKPQSTSQKIDYDNLYSYLTNFNKEKRTLEPIRKNILNSFIKILRIEGITSSENRYFSKKQLLNYLSEFHEDEYTNLKRNLFEWSIDIIRDKTDEVYNSIKEYIPNLSNIFEKEFSDSDSFINNPIIEPNVVDDTEQFTKDNIVNYDGFDIEVSTVHSVKGQTHTATLYLETSYQNGNDTYETQRLSSQLKYNDFSDIRKYHKQSTKMVYVGFSRPTDLLCVAVCKDRFDSHLSDIDRGKWEIVNI